MHLKDTTKEEIYTRIRAPWTCFGEILQDKQLPISLKKQVIDQCILPTIDYGSQIWSPIKQLANKVLLKEHWRTNVEYETIR